MIEQEGILDILRNLVNHETTILYALHDIQEIIKQKGGSK